MPSSIVPTAACPILMYQTVSELDFPHLGGIAEQTGKMVHERAGHLNEVAFVGQPAERSVDPQMAAC